MWSDLNPPRLSRDSTSTDGHILSDLTCIAAEVPRLLNDELWSVLYDLLAKPAM